VPFEDSLSFHANGEVDWGQIEAREYLVASKSIFGSKIVCSSEPLCRFRHRTDHCKGDLDPFKD